jgi:CheY-like chemotaxis protein/CRISPR/Cas system-associated protein endoribonuclease Cas2
LVSVKPDVAVQEKIDGYNQLVTKYKSENNLLELAKNYNKLGFLYWDINSTREASDYFLKSLELNKSIGNNNAIKNLQTNLGMIYYDAADYSTALKYFSNVLKLSKGMGNKANLCSDYINIAMVYQGQQNFEASNQTLVKALDIARELNNIKLMKNCYSMLAENYKELGNNEKSLEYFDLYTTLHKNLQNQQINQLESKAKNVEAKISAQERQLKSTFDTLKEVIEEKNEIQVLRDKEKQLAEMKIQQAKLLQEKEKRQNRTVLLFLGSILFISLIFIVVVLFQIKAKKKANTALISKNDKIEKQKQEIEKQRDIADEQRKKITDSILYAQRIQKALLPPENHIKELINDYFVFFRPRDIVSGDFYWINRKNNVMIIAAADCTGHGVPGAFMSMLGIAFMNEIVNKITINKHIRALQANEILNQLREQVIQSLHQTKENNQSVEGMDIALCIIDYEEKQLQFAGAHNPLYLVRKNELHQYKADKMPVSVHRNAGKPFTNHVINLEEGDMMYIFSDGFIDQFGGEKDEKFYSRRFKDLLVDIHELPMHEQKKIIGQTLDKWIGTREQLDDILIMGLKYSINDKKYISPRERNWQDKKILIVEDTDMNHFLLVEALKPTGAQLLRASNGKEAVEFCKQNETDLILMDINMPVMNGHEATRLIKEIRRATPIIAQTALDAEGEKEKSLESGCDDYISKPIDIQSFFNTIEKHLFK